MILAVQQKSPWEDYNDRAARDGWPVACDPELNFDGARLRDLVHIWQTARGRRSLPRRADITMRMLRTHLADTMLLDREQTRGGVRRYRIRFHGSNVGRMSGDGLGKFIDEVVPLQFVESWYFAYDMVLEMRAPVRFLSRFRALHLGHLIAERVVMPLGDGMGNPAGLITSVVYTSAPPSA